MRGPPYGFVFLEGLAVGRSVGQKTLLGKAWMPGMMFSKKLPLNDIRLRGIEQVRSAQKNL